MPREIFGLDRIRTTTNHEHMTYGNELTEPRSTAVAIAQARRRLPSPKICTLVRVAAGLSRQQIADALGVTATAVALWESGSRRPSNAHIQDYVLLIDELAVITGMSGSRE